LLLQFCSTISTSCLRVLLPSAPRTAGLSRPRLNSFAETERNSVFFWPNFTAHTGCYFWLQMNNNLLHIQRIQTASLILIMICCI
jgi:hypothetical protein